MLEALKFVQGAVAKKDFVPALTHFRIKDGFVRGFNGALSLCSPIDLDLDITPQAVPFVKAIQTCKSVVTMHVTDSGRLAVKSGKFKAFINSSDDTFPEVNPSGTRVELEGNLLEALAKLAPFMAEDASRPWANGILLRGQSAYATNNVILVEQWMPESFPCEINIPKKAVQELLRIKKEPIALQMDDVSATFWFDEKRWLRTNLLALEWPDVHKILQAASESYKPVTLEEEFFEAVENILPFADEQEKIYFTETGLTTHLDATGADMEILVDGEKGCYNGKQLLKLNGIANSIDFSVYPKPVPFNSDTMRGVIVGIRS